MILVGMVVLVGKMINVYVLIVLVDNVHSPSLLIMEHILLENGMCLVVMYVVGVDDRMLDMLVECDVVYMLVDIHIVVQIYFHIVFLDNFHICYQIYYRMVYQMVCMDSHILFQLVFLDIVDIYFHIYFQIY